MSPGLGKTILGGVVATIVFSLMMKFVAPMMLGHPMDVPAMIARMLGAPLMVGMAIHLGMGAVAFPFAYQIAFRFLPGPPLAKGIVFVFGLFLVAESVVMPMAGNGFWSADIGGGKAVMAAFLGHMVYGALLGLIAGHAEAPLAPATSRP